MWVNTAYLFDVVGSRAEVERVIHDTFLCSIGKLRLQCLYGSRLWIAVRHVHHRGYTSSRCSTAFARHVCFVCQSWVAEVYVVVNESW